MNKQYYKGIMLIPTMDQTYEFKEDEEHLYQIYKKIYEKYMFECSDIKIIFVYGKRNVIDKKEYEIEIEELTQESRKPGLMIKNFGGFEYVEKHYDYDFLIKSNLSTFWDLNKLNQRLNLLNKEKCFVGTYFPEKPPGLRSEHIGGFDMVMSRDVVQGLLNSKSQIQAMKEYHYQHEDVILSMSVKNILGINFRDNQGYDFINDVGQAINYRKFLADSEKPSPVLDHYRVRSPFRTRSEDVQILIKLLKVVYNKEVD